MPLSHDLLLQTQVHQYNKRAIIGTTIEPTWHLMLYNHICASLDWKVFGMRVYAIRLSERVDKSPLNQQKKSKSHKER